MLPRRASSDCRRRGIDIAAGARLTSAWSDRWRMVAMELETADATNRPFWPARPFGRQPFRDFLIQYG
jgi:hypothetical protein